MAVLAAVPFFNSKFVNFVPMNEPFWPVVQDNSVPKYKQIVNAVIEGVKSGKYAVSLKLPSLNEMTELSGASKETVYKAYDYLIKAGAIESHHGKGYYISDTLLNKEKTVLALLSEANPNMITVLKSFWETLGSYAKVTTVFHNQNPELLKKYLDSEYGKYDYYVIFPHFSSEQVTNAQIANILRRVPSDRTIVMDRYLPEADPSCGMVYQYTYSDILECMEKILPDFSNYSSLKSVPIYTSLYRVEIEDALKTICRRHHIPFENPGAVPDDICKGDVLFLYGCTLGSALVKLEEQVKKSGLEIGKDIGIICYDDFQINEILLGGLTTLSTDYSEMGREAAKMIRWGEMKKVHCTCNLIRRNSF